MPSIIEPSLARTVRSALSGWSSTGERTAPIITLGIFDSSGLVYELTDNTVASGLAQNSRAEHRIASMSKSFCAAATLQLAETGQLRLDDDVARYVPEFYPVLEQAEDPIPITVRMLLENSSGLPEDNASADYDMGRTTRNDFRQRLQNGVRITDYPGASYQYSNLGFLLLGLIIERVSNETYEDYVTTHILQPLRLTNTRFRTTELPAGVEVTEGVETLDDGKTWQKVELSSGELPSAAGLYSTIQDIAAWSRWLSSAYAPTSSGDDVLSRNSRRMMQRIHNFIPSVDDTTTRTELQAIGYGHGLIVEEHPRFGRFAQHTGGLPGLSTHMRWHIGTGHGIVILANTSNQPVGQWARDLHYQILSSTNLSAKTVLPWTSTIAIARAIEMAIREGDLTRIDNTLVSPNLFHDIPGEVRWTRLQEQLKLIGGLSRREPSIAVENRIKWAVSPAQIVWVLPARTGELWCEVELTEGIISKIQKITFTTKQPATPQTVARHYRASEPVSLKATTK